MSSVIQTERFQNIQIQPESVMEFPQGLIGFESYRQFALLDGKRKEGGLFWLQSLAPRSDLCFLLIEPERVESDYNPSVSGEDREMLGLSSGDAVAFLCLVTVDKAHESICANLKSPIAFNFKKRIGRQLILEDARFKVRHLIKSSVNVGQGAKKLEPA